MKLSIDNATGQVRLTLPPRASARDGLRWAEAQQAWIARALESRATPVPFEPGATILSWSSQGTQRLETVRNISPALPRQVMPFQAATGASSPPAIGP